ncbi:MAG: thioredoxin family protein [Nanoarchaeota archaeon]
MVNERKLKKSRYLIAFLITLAIFIIGILVGLVMSGERKGFLEEQNQIQRLDYDSINVQYLYLSNLLKEERDCSTASNLMSVQIDRLGVLGGKLEDFIKNANLDSGGFDLLKREYTINELRYWLFSKNVNDICDDDKVSILYFYSNNDCGACRTQGFVLENLKSEFGKKLLVFSLDSEFQLEPMLNIIKDKYNITATPTLVINEKKYVGLKNSDELFNLICLEYSQKPNQCLILK